MAFGLPQKTITQLKSVFKKYSEITQVKIYGSRVKGHYRRGSDIDLAFFSESEENLSPNISWELDDLPSPYLFDLVNYSTLNESPLKEEIDKHGKVLYRKSAEIPSSLKQNKSFVKKQQAFLHEFKVDEIKTLDTERAFEFKQTEIGEIPKDWEVCSISEIGDVITGTTPKTSNETYYGGQYKLISPADLDSEKYVNTAHRMLSEEGLSQCRTLPRYSVLVGCIGNVGKIGMTLDEKSATNQQINAIVCNQKSDPHFVFYCLFFFKKFLQLKASQTTVPILNKTNFKLFRIPCPPLSEQKKIAGILSQIQKAIEVQDKLIEATKELKQSTMKQLFTYGVKGQKTKQTDIGEIPENWEVDSVNNSYVFSKKPKNLNFNNFKKIAFIPMDLIPNDKLTLSHYIERNPNTISSGVYFESGDLLLSKITPSFENGKQCIIKNVKNSFGIATTEIIPIKEKKRISNIVFLFYYLLLDNIRHQIAGKMEGTTGRKRVPVQVIKDLKIPCPPLSEQKEIADILTKIDHKIQIHKKKKLRLKELFKTMLNQLMTGKIRVHKLDINAYSVSQ